jgi:hypothetical protein
MKAECIRTVGDALGRPLKPIEARNLERRLGDAMKREAARDPEGWQALPADERSLRGAVAAAQELIEEATKKRVRVAQTIVAHDRMRNFVASQLAAGRDRTGFDSVMRMLSAKADGKNNILSVEDTGNGIEAVAMGDLFDAWEAVHSNFTDTINGALGRESQTALETLLVRALHGEDVGRPEIMKAAKAFHDVAERLRQRFNAAGGEVGKLDNWGMPHAWSADRVTAAGKDAYVEAMLPLLDRRQYVHEDGRRYSDEEMRTFLGNAWQSIATGGANKPLSEVRTGGMRAKRHAEPRQIHFRDGESAQRALAQFSEVGVLDAVARHVQRMSRDIALVEQFGPNPDLAVSRLLDELDQQYKLAKPGRTAEGEATRYGTQVANLYDHLSGNTDIPLQVPLIHAFGWSSKYTVGDLFSDLRNLNIAGKLGSAFITSITDEATMHLTAHVNGISHVKLLMNELRTLNPADRTEHRIAGRAGLMAHTMLDELNRWGSQSLGRRVTGKLAATVVRLSGLNAITEARRRAYSVSMMDTLGALTREHASVSALESGDAAFLKKTGISEEHWQLWRLAQPEAWRGNDSVLTPQAIYRIPDEQVRALNGPHSNPKLAKDKAAAALMGFVRREQDIAVIEPGARERALVHMGSRPGTWKGELLRSLFLFKSFPIAMFTRHLTRAFSSEMTKGQRIAYGTALMAGTTIMGAIAMEANDLLQGKDPRSLNPGNERGKANFIAAVLKGGALGIYGDLLFSDPEDSGQSYLGQLGGPVVGTVESIFHLTLGNLHEAARGEDTHAGAELVRFAKGMTPGANLWYTKAITDHLILQQMQEYFSPGYLARVKANAQRDYGATYWWEPGAKAPERAPDASQATAP